MHDAQVMGGGQRIGDLDAQLEQLVEGHRPAPDALVEGRAVEALHDDEVAAVVLADVVNRADVWMVQPRGRPGLADEPLDSQRIARQIVGQELERDGASQAVSVAL